MLRLAGMLVIGTLILAFYLGTGTIIAQTVEVPRLSVIHMVDARTGWALAPNSIVRTTDGGLRWQNVSPVGTSGKRIPLGFEYALNATTAWAATSDGRVWRTTDGGATWRSGAKVTPLGQITFINPRDGWQMSSLGVATGSEAVYIFRTTDGGRTWRRVSGTDNSPGYVGPPTGLPFVGDKGGISFLNRTTGWITGITILPNTVYLYVTRDGGYTWQHQDLPHPPQITPPWTDGTTPPKFFTTRDGVMLVRFQSEWQGKPAPFPPPQYSVIYVTHDGGRTWAYTTSVSVAYRAWAFADNNHGWVTDGKVLHATGDGGRHWMMMPPSQYFTGFGAIDSLDFVSPRIGWALRTESPYLLRTTDGGRTWSPLPYTVSSSLSPTRERLARTRIGR